jgi:hypothetical protein
MTKSYSSRFRGVTRSGNDVHPWVAQIWENGKKRYLGSFLTEEEASAAFVAATASRVKRGRRRGAPAVGVYDDDRNWCEIEVGRDRWAKVDLADMRMVFGDPCWAVRNGYAYREGLAMHRLILGLSLGDPDQIDHINGDKLDNRRSNLRIATRSQNLANQQKSRGATSSRYKGVHWDRSKQKWRATIRSQHLGCFASEEDAARAYNRAARQAWGEYAYLNDVPLRLRRMASQEEKPPT